MKLYLDDLREPYPGWTLVETAQQAIDVLGTFKVSEVSLDHDLGDDRNGTGYDVLVWIEEKVFTDPDYVPPTIHVHTSNASAREKMMLCVETIDWMMAKRRLGE